MPAVLVDALAHLLQRACAVRDAERSPGEDEGQDRRVREYSAANDEVLRAVQLEEEQLARLEHAENAVPAGLPEVHFVEVRLRSEQLVPVAVGDPDERPHATPLVSSSCRS